jgi:diaminopimelate epimerase
MQAIGNDFVMIDALQNDALHDLHIDSSLATRISNRIFGIGCDGIVLYKKSLDHFFKENNTLSVDTKFFNSDGSEAEICGNASRCLGLLMKMRNHISKFVMSCCGKSYLIEVHEDSVTGKPLISVACEKPSFDYDGIGLSRDVTDPLNLDLRKDLLYVSDEAVDIEPEIIQISCISVGNPHMVLFVKKNISTELLKIIGEKFSRNDLFRNRINVSFARVISNNQPAEIELNVFERGAGLTMACGSGAVAAVLLANINGFIKSKTAIVRQRGGFLQIGINDDGSYIKIGSADYIFSGSLRFDSINLIR